MSSSAPAEPVAPTGTGAAAATAETAGGAATAHISAGITTLCANCGTPLTGKYCSQCGQRHREHPVHHFWHFISEAIEDLTHADSRVWQTLIALLFRPGWLTREFLEGRQVRYLPPVRLYLVVSVIFFVIAGLHSRIANPGVVFSDNGKSFQYRVAPEGTSRGLAGLRQTPAGGAGGGAPGLAVAAATPAGRQRLCEQSAKYIEQRGGWLASWGPRVGQSCLAAVATGGAERLNTAIEHNLERAMFLFLPLLALVMKLLYLKPPRYYVEHLLFFLHDHAFLFVILGASALLNMATASGLVLGPVDTAITIYIPIYFYQAMRRVYGQGPWLTLSKLAVLGVAYFFLGVLMIAATVSFSFLML